MDEITLETLILNKISLLSPPDGGDLWSAHVWMFECNVIAEDADPRKAVQYCLDELEKHGFLRTESQIKLS